MRRVFIVIYTLSCTVCLFGCTSTSQVHTTHSKMLTGDAQDQFERTILAPNGRYTQSPKKDAIICNKRNILKAYQAEVTMSNGVDIEEAVVIAQSEILVRGYGEEYIITKPKIVVDDERLWGIEFIPVNKTMRDVLNKPRVLVLIEKRSGKTRWNFVS